MRQETGERIPGISVNLLLCGTERNFSMFRDYSISDCVLSAMSSVFLDKVSGIMVYLTRFSLRETTVKHRKNSKTLPREHLIGCQGVKMFLLKDPFKVFFFFFS